jgi:hypothetical protein
MTAIVATQNTSRRFIYLPHEVTDIDYREWVEVALNYDFFRKVELTQAATAHIKTGGRGDS